MNRKPQKPTHPILAAILGLLGIAAAVLLCFLTGIIGGAIAGALGLAAAILGFQARKVSRKGLAGIITGALAILLTFFLTVSSVGGMTLLREKAAGNEATPLVEQYLTKPSLGLFGIWLDMPKDEATMQELKEQLDILMQ